MTAGGGEAGPTECIPAAEVTADLGGGTGRAGDTTAIALAALDDRFAPPCVDVPAGPVTLVIRNEGHHPHNVTTADGGSVAVDAGQVAILELSVESDMPYTCTIHPGMKGELRIEP